MTKGTYSNEELKMAEKARRSIHASRNLKVGDKIREEDISFKRPGYGIQPYLWKKIIGKKVIKNIKKDYWIKWDMLKR